MQFLLFQKISEEGMGGNQVWNCRTEGFKYATCHYNTKQIVSGRVILLANPGKPDIWRSNSFWGGCWVSVSWSYHLRQTLDKEWSKVWMAHVGCQCTSSPITTLRSQCGSLSCTYMCIWDQNEQQQCENNSGMTQFFQFSFQTLPFLLLLW